MKYFSTALLFASIAVAVPSSESVSSEGDNVKFPVDDKYTIEQAQAKCGNDAKLSCCNKATYTHDITSTNSGPPPGVIQTALGGGPGRDGLGFFGQCREMSENIPVLNVIGGGSNQPVAAKCKRNIACCQKNVPQANGNVVGVPIPCVALGSLI
ncbi:rodlet peptide [Aspergillus taichungensis]|uniref:Hydrophobin n=1 Tax=Aspergillus taichungensis TaxID=482145 RepID=A0A2J5HHC6_9EURO|nr:rodlet peptide [Aspergillus taichungensis]